MPRIRRVFAARQLGAPLLARCLRVWLGAGFRAGLHIRLERPRDQLKLVEGHPWTWTRQDEASLPVWTGVQVRVPACKRVADSGRVMLQPT